MTHNLSYYMSSKTFVNNTPKFNTYIENIELQPHNISNITSCVHNFDIPLQYDKIGHFYLLHKSHDLNLQLISYSLVSYDNYKYSVIDMKISQQNTRNAIKMTSGYMYPLDILDNEYIDTNYLSFAYHVCKKSLQLTLCFQNEIDVKNLHIYCDGMMNSNKSSISSNMIHNISMYQFLYITLPTNIKSIFQINHQDNGLNGFVNYLQFLSKSNIVSIQLLLNKIPLYNNDIPKDVMDEVHKHHCQLTKNDICVRYTNVMLDRIQLVEIEILLESTTQKNDDVIIISNVFNPVQYDDKDIMRVDPKVIPKMVRL